MSHIKLLVIDCVTRMLQCYTHRRCYFPPSSFQKTRYYDKIAKTYQTAIDNVLWNDNEGIWLDYDTKNKRSKTSFYPSNLSPLYTQSYDTTKKLKYAKKAVAYLKKNKIDLYYGEFYLFYYLYRCIFHAQRVFSVFASVRRYLFFFLFYIIH